MNKYQTKGLCHHWSLQKSNLFTFLSIHPEAEVALPLNVSDDHEMSFETILKMTLQSSKTEDSTTNNIHPEIKKNISRLKSCAEAPLIIDPELMKIYKKHGECFIWNIWIACLWFSNHLVGINHQFSPQIHSFHKQWMMRTESYKWDKETLSTLLLCGESLFSNKFLSLYFCFIGLVCASDREFSILSHVICVPMMFLSRDEVECVSGQPLYHQSVEPW